MTTQKARQYYSQFRKHLLQECFIQLQNSLYVRHYPTKTVAESVIIRLKPLIPEGAKVAFFLVTDKQYSMTQEFFGPKPSDDLPEKPEQLTLF